MSDQVNAIEDNNRAARYKREVALDFAIRTIVPMDVAGKDPEPHANRVMTVAKKFENYLDGRI